MTRTAWTDDQFLNGRVALRQHTTGHRAGSDAVLLAATVSQEFRGLIVDAGSASGAVGLMAAWRAQQSQLRLLEINSDELALARENIIQNKMELRAQAVEADLFASHADRTASGLCAGDADVVLSNPPYLDEGQVRASADEDRARAHMMPEGGLNKWILSCLQMLKSNGVFTLIHRADRLDDILHHMNGRFGDIAILPIHPREDAAATRILISGKRNSRAPLRILQGLVIHDSEGRFTTRMAAVHAGDASLILR